MNIAPPPPRIETPAAWTPHATVALAGLAALLLAVFPWLGPLAYPFRLLTTIVHELSHGLAAVLTGGAFLRFVIFPDGSGLAYTAGGWRLVIIPAGYLGSALFGAALILAGRSVRWSRGVLAGLGVVLLVLSLRYGAPGLLSTQFFGALLTIVSGILLGAAFLWVARAASVRLRLFLLNLVAIQAGLTAFADLLTLIGISTRLSDVPANDALAMAQLTGIPALFWALVWALLAALLVGGAIWHTWLRRRA